MVKNNLKNLGMTLYFPFDILVIRIVLSIEQFSVLCCKGVDVIGKN